MMAEREIQETELCVVCNKPGLNFDVSNSSQEIFQDKVHALRTQQETETHLILPQLRVIFLLQQIFKHPLRDQGTLENLQALGNPSEWVEICQRCSDLVDNGIDVLRKLKRYEEEFKDIVKKLETKFSSSYWGEPWNLEGSRIFVKDKNQEKICRRAEFRKRIRKIEITPSNYCEIKSEPGYNAVDEDDWNPMEVSYPSTSFDAGGRLNREDEINCRPNDQTKRKRGRPKKSSSNTCLTSAQESNLVAGNEKHSSNDGTRSRGSRMCTKKKVESIEDDNDMVPVHKEKPSYIFKESEDEVDGFDDDFSDSDNDYEDPNFSSSSGSDYEEGIQGNKVCRRASVRSAKIGNHWFYKNCEEYLDMSNVEYPLGMGSQSTTESAIDANCDWKKEGFPCSSCDKLFRNRFLAIAHIQNVHMGIKKPWKCNKCPYKAKVLRTFQRHIQEHDLGSLRTCSICGKSSRKSKIFMDTHVINHQKGSSTPTCHECQQSFPKFQNYLEHMTVEHGLLYRPEGARKKKSPQVCQHCNKSLATELQLKFHLLKKHNQSDKYDERFPVCSECGDICFDRANLAVHMARSHPAKLEGGGSSFFCDQCGKEYKVEQDLKLHLKTVHTGEIQKCHICGMVYNNSKTLQSHLSKYHAETKDMNSEQLEQYIIKKNVEKSCRCNLCPEAFPFSVLLYHHYRTDHPEVTEKFKCDICGKGFSRQCSVKIHKEASHNDEKFTCEDCGKVFTCREGLMQHKRKNCPVTKQKLN